MTKLLTKIGRLAAINWSTSLQYRADLLLWLLTEAATPVISMALWYAVALSSNHGPTPQETLNYYILTMLVIILTNSWNGYFLSQEILNGSIVQRLMKPVSVFWDPITNNLTYKALRLLIPMPLFLISLWLFPHFYVASLHQLMPWVLFTISLCIAACLSFFLDMSFGFFAFWLEDALNLRWFKDTLQMITSGILIPLAVMPTSVQHVINFLPFRHIITTPIQILMGSVSGPTLTHLLTIQASWAVTTGILMTILWKQGLKRYAPPGQ